MSDETDKQPDEKRKRRRTRKKADEGGEAAPKRRTRRKKADDATKAQDAVATAEAAEAGATGEAEAAVAVPEVTDAAPTKADAPAEEAQPPTRSAPRRRRQAPEPGAAPPVVRARARYVRSSARKARLVCDHIRGKSVEEARAILAFTPRDVARDWSKLLESAVANAEHNHELLGEDLRVQEAFADEGPTLKRYRPRAMGRATRIRKRTAHLTIALTPGNGAGRAEGQEGSR